MVTTNQISRTKDSYGKAYFRDFKGIISTGEVYKRDRGYQLRLKNFELHIEGKACKARGYTTLGTWLNNRIRKLIQYKNSSKDVVLAFGSNAAGTSAGIAEISGVFTSSLTFTPLLTLTDVSTTPALVEVSDKMFLFNGSDDQFWDGTTWYDINADAPLSAAVSASTIDGNLNQSSNYVVAWRWLDSTRGRRTNLSPLATFATGASSSTDGLRVTLPSESAPAGFDRKEILVSVAFGSQLFVDQNVTAATTTVDITDSDQVRSKKAIFEGDLYAKPYRDSDIATFIGGIMFAARTDDNQCRVQHTWISTEYGPQPHGWPPKYFVDIDPSETDLMRGIGYTGSQEQPTPIVFKQKSFGKLISIGGGRYKYQKLGSVGLVNKDSVLNIEGLCVWESDNNIWATDGNSFWAIGGEENGEGNRNAFSALSQVQQSKFYAFHKQKDKQMRFIVVRAGEEWSDRIYYGQYTDLTREIVKWTTREPGVNSNTHPGLNVACMAIVTDSQNVDRILAGNSLGNGKLYECDTGDQDDGNSIYAECIFKPENFGDPTSEKFFGDAEIRIRTRAQQTPVSFTFYPNLSDAPISLFSENIDASGIIFGSSTFPMTFGGSPNNYEIIPVNLRAIDGAIGIRQTTDKYIEILDLTMQATG